MSGMIEVLNQWGNTLVHYAWLWTVQSFVLLVIVLILDRLLRNHTQAIFRYGLWTIVLFKLTLPPTLSLPSGIAYWFEPPQVTASKMSPHSSELSAPVASGPQEFEHSATVEPLSAPQMPELVPSSPFLPRLSLAGMAMVVWLTAVVIGLGLWDARIRYVRRLIEQAQAPDEDLSERLAEAREQGGYRGRVRLQVTEELASPAVCGLFRPLILFPRDLLDDLSDRDIRLALLHELAHLKRHDLWINAWQTLLTVVHCYNPVIWVVNAVLHRLCERAVDETVVAWEGRTDHYSHALINIGERVTARPIPIGLRLIGVMESQQTLQWRIKQMVTRPMPKHVRLGFGGFVVLVVLAAVLLPMAHATTENDPDGYHLLVLDNCNPDTKGKESYGDRLYMLDSQGRTEAVIEGFNQCESVGGSHVMAIDKRRKTLWVAENVGRRLWQFDLKKGCLIRQIPDMKASAVAVDPDTGNAWIVINSRSEDNVKVVSPTGELVAQYEISGFDIAYSRHDRSFWVVGKNVYKINTKGAVTGQIENKIPWRALSVSIDDKSGDAWIVIGYHFQVQGSKPQLWCVDKDGETIKKTIDIHDVLPRCVTVDAEHDNVWVGCQGTTLRFNTQGEKLESSRGATGFSLALGPAKNTVFSASIQVWLNSWLDDGRVGMFPLENDQLSDSQQKWLAVIPFDDAKLNSSPELASMVPDPITQKPAKEVNAESEGHLSKLGKAMLMYANDYEDRYPDTMDPLKPYGIDLAWCKSHVNYQGKGKSPIDDPELILAFDKSMLKEKDYTAALMNDGHVEVLALKDVLEKVELDVMTRMREIGLAMLIYADDHDRIFPDTLEQVAPYGIDISWCTENVTYLGKGKTTRTRRPSTVLLAYHKGFAKDSDYTVGVFMDGHTERIDKRDYASYDIQVSD